MALFAFLLFAALGGVTVVALRERPKPAAAAGLLATGACLLAAVAMPQDATHLVVSVGGNNALGEKAMIEESARSVAEVLDKLAKIKAEFAKSYGAMLDGVLARKLPAAVCTIYEARYQDPTTRQIAGAGLTVFNDVIMRVAFARGMPVIDLRLVFDEDADYANDIEPSVKGGAKIARVIATLVTTHDFTRRRSEVYV